MADVEVTDWSQINSSNTTISGVNINTGCPPASMNQMGRAIMGAVARAFQGVKSVGPLAFGGTKATGLANGTASGDAVHFGQFAQTLANQTGYITLPGGLIFQWSEYTLPTGNGDRVTFPVPFTNNFIVIAGSAAGGSLTASWTGIGSLSSFSAFLYTSTTGTPTPGQLCYLAIGY